jgi:hypothetical protein
MRDVLGEPGSQSLGDPFGEIPSTSGRAMPTGSLRMIELARRLSVPRRHGGWSRLQRRRARTRRNHRGYGLLRHCTSRASAGSVLGRRRGAATAGDPGGNLPINSLGLADMAASPGPEQVPVPTVVAENRSERERFVIAIPHGWSIFRRRASADRRKCGADLARARRRQGRCPRRQASPHLENSGRGR